MKHTAIILKKLYPHESKVALIDQKKGRINAIGFNTSFIEGAIIEYTAEVKYGSIQLDNIDLLYVPLQWGVTDILFLHHVLEICYYGIPIESCARGIFELLCMLFRHEESLWRESSKKMFISKLLLLMGMYPQTNFMKTKIAASLLHISVEDMLQLKIDEPDQILMDQWLKQCFMHYNLEFNFKTGIFLTKGE